MNIIKILVISMLGITGAMDLKWKKLNILMVIPFFIAGILCNLKYNLLTFTSILGGMAIGVVMIGIGVITRQKIGYGDGVILIVTGLFLGFFDNLFLLLSSTFLSAIVGALLLLIKGMDKNYELPFLPFLFLSFLGDLVLWS